MEPRKGDEAGSEKCSSVYFAWRPKTLHTAKALVMGAQGIGQRYASIPGSDVLYAWVGDTPEDLANAVDFVRGALEDMESIEK